MKMVFVLLLITFTYISCAQQKMGIEKVYAFNQLRFPGNIQVDDNGNALITGPDTVTYIYIETSGRAPAWNKAIMNGIVYTVSAAPIEPTPVDIGKEEVTGKPVVISKRSGNTLWQITLLSREGKRLLPARRPKESVNEIILEGTSNGRPCRQIIKKQVVLIPQNAG